MRIPAPDFALGIAAILLAAAYLHGASRIPDSHAVRCRRRGGPARAVGLGDAACRTAAEPVRSCAVRPRSTREAPELRTAAGATCARWD
jgi:hypothetical protein